MYRFMTKRLGIFFASALVLFLTISLTIGGCDKKKKKLFFPPAEQPDVGGTVYNCAFSVGDLATYQLNTSTLEYSYRVLEMGGLPAFETGNGTLVAEPAFGPYVYTDDLGEAVVLLPDKLVLLGISDGGLAAGVPARSTSYNLADIEGMYNFIQYGFDEDEDKYRAMYGTILMEDGTFKLWFFINGTDNPDNAIATGTWSDQGDGIIHVYTDEFGPFIKVGNLMFFPSANGNVLVMDFSIMGGIAMGVEQQTLTAGDYDGTYDVVHSSGSAIYTLQVTGATVTDPGGPISIIYNFPWDGFVTDMSEFLAILSTDGILIGAEVPGGADDSLMAAIKE